MENQPIQNSKTITRNVLYGFSTWILPLVLSFIATPVIVKSLGHEDYGIYSLVLGFIGYSFTFSIGRSLTKFIAEYRIKGDTEKIRDLISATFFLNILVGLISILSIFSLSEWLVRDVFKIEPESQSKTILAMYIASIVIFATMLNQVFIAILQGIQRFDVFSKIYNAVTLLLLAGNILLAYTGYGFLFLLWWNLAVVCLNCVVGLINTKRLLPEFKLHLKFSKESLKLVIKYSSGVIAYQILSNILLLFERGWITAKLGSESLTYYVVPMSLSIYLHGFISSLTLVIFPLASESREDLQKLLRIYTKATKLVCALVGFFAVTLIIESHLFLSLWISPEFADNSSLVLIFHVITFSLIASQITIWQLSEGLSSPIYNICVSFFYLVLSVPLMIFLTDAYGIRGIAFGRMFAVLITAITVIYAEKVFLGETLWRFRTRIFLILFFAMILTALTEKFVFRLMSPSWLNIFLTASSGAVIYFLTLFVFRYISKDEIRLFRRIFGV